jgi:hypothetical protein
VELLSEIKEFFNDLSLYTFQELATMDYEDIISSKLDALKETFERDIEELKRQSIGNKTRTVRRQAGLYQQSKDKLHVAEDELANMKQYLNEVLKEVGNMRNKPI